MFRQIFLFLQLSHYFFLKTKEQPLPPFLSHLHFHGYLLFVPPSEYHLGALSFAGTQGQLGCRARQQRGCWVPFVTGRFGSGTRVLWGRKLAEVAILYCCTFLFFFFFPREKHDRLCMNPMLTARFCLFMWEALCADPAVPSGPY